MKNMTLFFIGIAATFALALTGMVLIPYVQLNALPPYQDTDELFHPLPQSGLANAGEAVYARHGCIYCHSQQARPQYAGADIERGWGQRQTVARDYIYRKQTFLGKRRFGPDLANIGSEMRGRDANWLHQHLYAPKSLNPKSQAPSFRFLYKKKKIVGQPSENALQITGAYAPEEGYEIVPTRDAIELVAYLQSLNPDYPLPEAPLVVEAKKKEAATEPNADTVAPALPANPDTAPQATAGPSANSSGDSASQADESGAVTEMPALPANSSPELKSSSETVPGTENGESAEPTTPKASEPITENDVQDLLANPAPDQNAESSPDTK